MGDMGAESVNGRTHKGDGVNMGGHRHYGGGGITLIDYIIN